MEKTINISGRDIRLKTNGLVPIMYRKEFQRDFFKDFASMQKAGQNMAENFNLEYFINLTWLYARLADNEVPDRDTWLASFDEFPIMDYAAELIDLTMCSLTTTNEKNSKSKAK